VYLISCDSSQGGRLLDDDSDGKFPASFTTQEFECETGHGDWGD